MGEHGVFARFPGNLDPTAQEFRPSYPSPPTGGSYHIQYHHFSMYPQHHHPQQLLYPFTTTVSPPTMLPPPPPPPYHHHNPPSHHSLNFPSPDPSVTTTSYFNSPPTLPPLPPPSNAPTRALLLSSVPLHSTSESTLRRDLEPFGDVRSVQMDRAGEGIVAIHFYDLRAAHDALEEIRDQHMQQQSRLRAYYYDARAGFIDPSLHPPPPPCPPPGARGLVSGSAVWAQFMIPGVNAFPDGHNQGTLVVFNLDSQISTATLRDIFETFGSVRELRETPAKKHQRFVEYFDIRDAARALTEMNGREICGRQIVIEFSRPGGGHGKRYQQQQQHFNHHRYSYNNNNHNFIGRHGPPSNNMMSFDSSTLTSPPSQQPYVSPRRVSRRCGPPVNAPPRATSSMVAGPPVGYSTTGRKQNFGCRGDGNRVTTTTTSPGNRKSPTLRSNSSPVGQMMELSLNENSSDEGKENNTATIAAAAAMKNCNSSYNVDTGMSSGSSSTSSGKVVVITKPREVRGGKQGGCNGSGSSRPWKGKGRNFDPRFLIKEDAIVDPVAAGYKDSRTTVMIKNIPNKYSQKLLLNMLDNHCIHCNEQIHSSQITSSDGGAAAPPLSSYDFVYLPIDFNNKCNVGYGFVNMTSPEATLRLYKSFHQQHWEVFNSRKICEVTYARVQGLESLKEHFKNSKFACETDEYLPVVFSPPRDGRGSLSPPLPIVIVSSSSTRGSVGGGGGGSTTTMSCSPKSMPSSDDDDVRDYYDVSVTTTTTPPSLSDDGGNVYGTVNTVDDDDDDDCGNDDDDDVGVEVEEQAAAAAGVSLQDVVGL